MVRIIRHFPENRPNDTNRKPLFEKERSLYSIATEDTFDDLLAGLTHRPDAATPDVAAANVAAPNVAVANVAAANIAAPNVAANEPARAKLPSVEEFHFDEAAARNMASKLAPNQKPRIKSRRPRYRSPNRDRWRFPDEPHEHDDEREAESWGTPQDSAAPGGAGRGLFWSFCASILIVMGTSAAFAFVQPLNDLLPNRMGDFLGGLSKELGANLFERPGTSAEVEMAAGNPNSDKDILIPDRPEATVAVARPVSTTTVAGKVRPSVNNGGSGVVDKDGPTGAAAKQTYELGTTVLKLGAIDDAEAKFATPEPAPAPLASPAAVPVEAPAATRSEADKNKPRKPALRQTVKADRPTITDTPALANDPVASAARPPVLSLSGAEIDRLLARGEKLLQSGNIASARLLFQRVAAAGDRRGARGVGMTYDPAVYARLPVTGLTPDRKQAEYWYKIAGENSALTANRSNAADTRGAQEPGSAERNAACARKYSSFEPSTGLYTSHSGVKRPCKLP